uniref:Uncharacterized protein n=1 Tax=Rhizophora mucronata TaxID=61149 RepID=A0A2P2Q5F2_RHIMU
MLKALSLPHNSRQIQASACCLLSCETREIMSWTSRSEQRKHIDTG